MEQCSEKGYPIRVVLMPIIPVKNWEVLYKEFLQDLLSRIQIQRLTLGGICSYPNARRLMECKIEQDNAISMSINKNSKSEDGRMRYSTSLRAKMYSYLIDKVREIRPKLDIALCLEEQSVWEAVHLESSIGLCNCVL